MVKAWKEAAATAKHQTQHQAHDPTTAEATTTCMVVGDDDRRVCENIDAKHSGCCSGASNASVDLIPKSHACQTKWDNNDGGNNNGRRRDGDAHVLKANASCGSKQKGQSGGIGIVADSPCCDKRDCHSREREQWGR